MGVEQLLVRRRPTGLHALMGAACVLRRYIFLLGMLMSQFTITGFDACGARQPPLF